MCPWILGVTRPLAGATSVDGFTKLVNSRERRSFLLPMYCIKYLSLYCKKNEVNIRVPKVFKRCDITIGFPQLGILAIAQNKFWKFWKFQILELTCQTPYANCSLDRRAFLAQLIYLFFPLTSKLEQFLKLYRRKYSSCTKYPDTREKLMEKRHFLSGTTATILRLFL